MARKPRDALSATEVASTVASTPKYAPIVRSLVDQIASDESARATSFADAVKRTKRKLHQMIGAYLSGRVPGEAELNSLVEARSELEQREICLRLLNFHASARERAENLEETYSEAFKGLTAPRRIVDLACGLNPLGRVFMPLPRTTVIGCYDAHSGLVDFVAAALKVMDYPVEGAAWNLLEGAPPGRADVALLLKTLPCLMQAQRDVVLPLLESIDAERIIVSFPVASLAGGKRRMGEFWADQFLAVMEGARFAVERVELRHEVLFRVVPSTPEPR
ncbi:MAG TPA: hypothetical protein VN240_07200 [Propylenella sp.]|nr:hypothetical protein [Propylenella sp.]